MIRIVAMKNRSQEDHKQIIKDKLSQSLRKIMMILLKNTKKPITICLEKIIAHTQTNKILSLNIVILTTIRKITTVV